MPGWTMKAFMRTHAASARQPSAACTAQSNFKRVSKGGPAPRLRLLILSERNEGAEPLARTGAANAALQRQTTL